MTSGIDISQISEDLRGYVREFTRAFANGVHDGEVDPRETADAAERGKGNDASRETYETAD